jgi:hypothetical protein
MMPRIMNIWAPDHCWWYVINQLRGLGSHGRTDISWATPEGGI